MTNSKLEYAPKIVIIKNLQKAFLNKENLDLISYILEGIKEQAQDSFDLFKYLSAMDITMISYNEIIREHQRSKGDSFDI